MDQYTYTRVTYTFLDYMRDIGGLFGAFNAIFGALIFILNFNGLYQFITSRLFQVQTFEYSVLDKNQKDNPL